MAMISCPECKKEVSNKAEKCPNCGYKIKSKTGCLTYLVIGFFVLVVFSLLGKPPSKPNKPVSITSNQGKSSESTETPAAPAPITSNPSWSYQESSDQLTNKITKSAVSLSINKVELDFPYSGGTYGYIQIRKHPRYGTDAIFRINKGQLLCNSDNCRLLVRFDDQKPRRFNATEPEDNSSETLFINDSKKFIAELKKAKKAYVEAQFYQNGNYVFEFNVENLVFN